MIVSIGGEEDKSNICSLLQFVYPPYIKGEWRKIDMSGKQNIGNFDKIVDQALKLFAGNAIIDSVTEMRHNTDGSNSRIDNYFLG